MRDQRVDIRPIGIGLVVLVLAIAASVVLAERKIRDNEQRVQDALASVASDALDRLRDRLTVYELGMRGTRAAVHALGVESLPREAFREYIAARDLSREFPGTRGIGFIRRVPLEREAAYVDGVRRSGEPDFKVRQVVPSDQERWVIEILEPRAGNEAALGLDIASEAQRRRAAQWSARSGEPGFTGPITLVQATQQPQQAHLLLLPFYRRGMPLGSEEEREAATVGWVYLPMIAAEVLRDLVLADGTVKLQLDDITDGDPVRFFEQQAAAKSASAAARSFEHEVYGRRWRFTLAAEPQFVQRLHLPSPDGTLLASLTASLLLAALSATLLVAVGGRRGLAIEQARLARVVADSSDAIVTETTDGLVTSLNRTAMRMFGKSETEWLGHPFHEVFRDDDSRARAAARREQVLRGETVEPYEEILRSGSGDDLPASISISPIRGADGRLIGISKTIRDLRAQAEAERQRAEFTARLAHDVAERTAQLDAARHDLQTVLDALPSMIGYWDAKLRNRFANHAYREWFGLEPEAIVGRTIPEVIGPDMFERNRAHIEAALRGEPQTFERAIPVPGGHGERQALAHYVPDIRDGEVRGFYVLVHDVSELTASRMRLAEAQRENEALLHTLKTYALYSVADADGTIIDVNDGFCQISGYTRDELMGRNHRIVSSGRHPPVFWAAMWRTISAGHPWRGQICNRAKDGSLYWVDSLIAPFLGIDGKVQKYISIRTDITASKQAAAELATERQRLDDILRGTHVGTWEWNVQTGETRFNERWAEIVGYTLAELQPTTIETWSRLAHPDDLARSGALLERHFAGELPQYECEARMRHRDGHWVWVLDRGRVTSWTPDGEPEWMHGTHQDISERRAADDALREAKQAAEAASAAKSAFLANTSHEIRTPLNAIIGLAYLLEHGPLDADQRGYVGKIQLAGRTLLGVLNDVLDLAKIEAGETQLDKVAFDLPRLLQGLMDLHGHQAREKNLLLEREWEPTVPRRLVGDAGRLQQIVGNLLSNAIKFTERGFVRLTVRTVRARAPEDAETAAARVRLRFEVEDSGVGIDAAVLPRLFEPFAQADASTTRRFGGTGLGLSIVRQLATLMNGEVGAQSEPGRGSRFWVEVECELPAVGEPESDLRPLRVLLVDDDAAQRAALATQMETLGWTVEALPDARAALARLGDPALGRPDAIVVDWRMPGIDGIQLLTTLKEQDGAHVPAALLVSADPRLAEAATTSQAVMTLPADASTLFNAVNEAVRRSGGADHLLRSTRFDRAGALWLPGVRVMVVDDSEINLEVASRILALEAADVTVCGRARDAIGRLRDQPGAFDLVLMDVQMPDMDGLEATRVIRGELGLSDLPVVALTAGALVTEKQRALAAGMDDFVTKPFEPDTLIRVVRRHVERRRGAPLPVQPRPNAAPATTVRWPEIDGIDTAAARARLKDDLPLFTRLLRHLFLEFADLMTAGPSARNDAEAAERLAARAHKLRGSAGLLGAQRVREQAGRLEESLRPAGAAEPASPDLVTALTSEVAQALRDLHAAAATWFEITSAGDKVAAADHVAAGPVAMPELRERLRQNDLKALECFEVLAPALAGALGPHRFAALRERIEGLRFREALEMLPEDDRNIAGRDAAPGR